MGGKSSLPSKRHSYGTLFENLSNDILLELFDYFFSNEIYLSFGYLNSRFDTLINSYPQHVNFQLNTIIPPHIRSLKITRKDQVSLLFSLYSSQKSTIRGLTIGNLRAQQVLDLLNVIELERLEYLYLGICQESVTRIDLIESAQTQILALGKYRLRRCHLRGRLLANINNLPLSLPTLEYVHLDGCPNFSVLSSFLSRMPNLKFLRVSMLESTNNPLQAISCRITHIVLRPHSECSIEQLELFFTTCCSHIEKLIVERFTKNSDQSKLLFSKQVWARILPDRVSWFYLKSKNSADDYLLFNNCESSKLYDKFWPMSSEHRNPPCQAIVEKPFSSVW